MYGKEAMGALLDLYEQALLEIGKMIEDIPDTFLSILLIWQLLTRIAHQSRPFYPTSSVQASGMRFTFII